MQIVLIRHGQPEWVRDGLNVTNPPLTELGRAQAELLGDWLADEQFDEILASPLARARETAAPLLERQGRDETIEPWLEEIRDPSWHGTPAEKAQALYKELAERAVNERWDGLIGGESIRDFAARIHAGADEFLRRRGVERIEHEVPLWSIDEPGRTIALVAHAGTNSITIGHLLGLDPTPWEWDRFVLGHASVTRIEALPVNEGFAFSLTSLSNLEHLPRDLRTR